jgi:hypothetical protein
MLTEARFRALALALPDVVEGAHGGHPDFRANGRVMASLLPPGRAMVKVAPARQRELVAADANTWAPATGAWGKAGCTLLVLATAGAAEVGEALRDAWQVAMAQPEGRAKPAPRKGRRPGRTN